MKTIITQVVQSIALGTVIPGLLFSVTAERPMNALADDQAIQPTLPIASPVEPEKE